MSKLRDAIMKSLWRNHPDVNKGKNATRNTRALIVLLKQESEITRRGGMTYDQAQEFLQAYGADDDPDQNPGS